MEVLVEHDYIAKEHNELSIAKGDIIKDVVRRQGGWWEGTLRDKTGLFPDNFVRVIDKEADKVVLRNRKDAARIRQCRVVFSYKQDHEDELSLNVGDVIEILGEEEEGWWRGVLNGRQGVFPSNFVEEIVVVPPKVKNSSRENLTDLPGTDMLLPSVIAKPVKVLCEVKFAYKAQNEDELSLKEGDLVTLLSKDGQDPGWWKGELNGLIGVFPDNFVTLLPTDEKGVIKDDRKAKVHAEPNQAQQPPFKSVTSQRKSLEVQANDSSSSNNSNKSDQQHPADGSKVIPPVPSKKPLIPIKKSPSGSGSSGGLFYGLKKKIVDAVDGATGSKNISPPKTEPSGSETTNMMLENNAFDDVVRRPLLADVRATRPKAPGRRLPSMIGKELEPGVMNGNSVETMVVDGTPTPAPHPSSAPILGSSPEIEAIDSKPKLREWEKHKAPWLAEMKLNQAKRTSTSPGPPEHKLKLTPTDKATGVTDQSAATEEHSNAAESTPAIDSLPKSVSPLKTVLKTPPNELEKKSEPILRSKTTVPMPVRPQTIHSVNNDTHLTKPSAFLAKVSPLTTKTPSPLQKISSVDRVDARVSGDKSSASGDTNGAAAAAAATSVVPGGKQYLELADRVLKLEEQLEKQNQVHTAAIEELRHKLQLEMELRMELQAKVEALKEHIATNQ